VNDPIPLVDLKIQYQSIRTEVLHEIDGVLQGMRLTLGPQVGAFETEFAAYCGTGHCIGVGSGTEALWLALRACGIGPGDEVIIPAHTFIATAEAVSLAGATPVVVDVEQGSRCLDPLLLEAAITARSRAVIPVHMHGQMADLDQILPIARAHSLLVIEDAAQAHGAELHGRRAGSMGDLGCFSFYCSKNLGAYGEAGAVTTNNPGLAETLRLLRNHGDAGRYEHISLGTNSRLDEMQAAVLRVKLRHLDTWNTSRRNNAERLMAELTGLELNLPTEAPGRRHVYHHFAVLASKRSELQQELASVGVMTGIHYPRPIHLQRPYQDLKTNAGRKPIAEQIAERTLSLPLYAELTDDQIERIAKAVRQSVKKLGV
jgi:dTDP-4-amino-4,6-dideoxygalactose transaminase